MSAPIARVLDRLGAVKREREGQYQARCPAHEDREPSLSVGTGSDGRVLIHCQAGCKHEAVVAALGLEERDLFADDAPPRNGHADIVATYDYHDMDGDLLYQVVRRFPKSFAQRRPDGRGAWAWNLNGTPRVLYRLPELVEAAALGRTVFLTEGEKDADRLAAHGLAATTNPGGAGNWRRTYHDTLRDADVVIVPDNDEAGQRHAEMVAAELGPVASRVRILTLPGLAEKGDVSDWLDAGHTAEELLQLADAAPKSGSADTGDDDPALPSALCALDAERPDAPAYRVEALVLEREIHLFVSDGGVGKTTVSLALGGAVAGGAHAFDCERFAVESGPVLFVSEEDGLGVILNRLEALIRGHGWDRERVLGRFYILAQGGADLDSKRWQDHLLDEIRRTGAVLVILDPFSELTSASENSRDEVRPVIRFLRRITTETAAGVIVLHHAGKVVEGKRKLDRIRGSSALNAAARGIYFLEEMDVGISVECLKLSRGEKAPKFVVRREVRSDPENRAVWTEATMRHVSEAAAEEESAQRFVLERLARHGDLNSGQIKDLAKGSGHSAIEISNAVKELHAVGQIDFRPGEKRNEKRWQRTDGVNLPRNARQAGQADPAEPAETCPAGSEAPTEPAPIYRGAGWGQAAREPGQAEVGL